MTKIDKIEENIEEYDEESKLFLKSLKFVEKEIGIINEMKQTSGWTLMSKKIREELRDRIDFLVKDDGKVQTLIALLNVADTKTTEQLLNEEIERILPDP